MRQTTLVDPDGRDVRVCVQDGDNKKCWNMSDSDYLDLANSQNAAGGQVQMPTGLFSSGSITCGNTTCGSAQYFEPGMSEDTGLEFALIGAGRDVASGLMDLGSSLLGRLESGTGEALDNAAHNATDYVRLRKSLASEEQMASSKVDAIAGSGARKSINDINRLAGEYGGSPEDWQKLSHGEAYRAPDGTMIETHSYRNIKTGQVVEMKSKMGWFRQ